MAATAVTDCSCTVTWLICSVWCSFPRKSGRYCSSVVDSAFSTKLIVAAHAWATTLRDGESRAGGG